MPEVVFGTEPVDEGRPLDISWASTSSDLFEAMASKGTARWTNVSNEIFLFIGSCFAFLNKMSRSLAFNRLPSSPQSLHILQNLVLSISCWVKEHTLGDERARKRIMRFQMFNGQASFEYSYLLNR